MNYYEEISDKVELLWHFPYPEFNAFKEAVEKGEVVNTGIPMDYARQWVTQGADAPKGWMILSNILLTFPYLLTIFYIVTAFINRNYWLILYSIIPIIFMFFFNPLARRAFKMHYYFIGIYILAGIFIKSLWEPIYWLPLVVDYLALNQLYEGSAQLVRENLHKNEKLLCWFWKRGNLQIELKDGSKWADRYIEKDGKTNFYEDVDREWKEYFGRQDKKFSKPSIQQQESVNSEKTIDNNQEDRTDPLYEKAVQIAQSEEIISADLLHKKLSVGYARAARLFDILAENGVILLDQPKGQATPIENNVRSISLLIQKTLEAFGVFIKAVDVLNYKDFTEYRFELAVGTSIEQLTERSPDIAMAVASPTGKIKIHAPIPGTSLIGIIIPKTNKSKINLNSKPIYSK